MKHILLRIINRITPKSPNRLLFIPHDNCFTDKYDVFNWESDNVLCVLRSMLYDSRFKSCTLYIVYYDESKIAEYRSFARSIADRDVVFIKKATLDFIFAFLKSSIVITASAHTLYKYKVKTQINICLGYYTPFKDDFWYIKQFGWKKQRRFFDVINNTIDYYITSSDLSSRIISTDFLLLYSHCLPIGVPRNDIFYHESKSIINKVKKTVGYDFKKLIVYTPTFRDYESVTEGMYSRSIFGDISIEKEAELNHLLGEQDAVLVAKLHPLQEKRVIGSNHLSRVIFYSDLSSKETINLYQLLSCADCLITDYTSTSYDYMHKDSPIIYYFYDYKKYAETRNFCINPIQSLCGGNIVYTFEDLLLTIKEAFNSYDNCNQRRRIHDAINFYHDDKSTERVSDFIYSLLDH